MAAVRSGHGHGRRVATVRCAAAAPAGAIYLDFRLHCLDTTDQTMPLLPTTHAPPALVQAVTREQLQASRYRGWSARRM
ncbi:hypothetical protein BS329_41420 [Amycolatopsis coloradensis]|uniref:Uncharacterized protein n=1 Tax=Amycolatopsis coloradensis TaxID=76021 RepID=A0A1R0KD46_9PSEU|nr:hypothetical protein BS329_41420 [Amycolatopsis coloradensis]